MIEVSVSSSACYQSEKYVFTAAVFATFAIFLVTSVTLVYSLSVYCANLTPEDEDTPVLKYARCTCISQEKRKGAIVIPFIIVALLAFYNVVNTWYLLFPRTVHLNGHSITHR